MALQQLSGYYERNLLRPNPNKTESCVFHLRNHEADRKLKIIWDGVNIRHSPEPKYLGVILDRSLTYRINCQKLGAKVRSRNNILRRLTTTHWGASPHVLRTSGLALSYSAGEYASPVWARSTHSRKVDVALNDTCRLITGTLKPTPLCHLYRLAGIAPPCIRRDVSCAVEKYKQSHDSRHPLYGQNPPPSRLKSRSSFLRQPELSTGEVPKIKLQKWKALHPPTPTLLPPAEKLPPGGELPWAVWKALNRLRAGVGRCQDNRARWGFSRDNLCSCGAVQTMAHLMNCPNCPASCSTEDLIEANDRAVEVAKFWSKIL